MKGFLKIKIDDQYVVIPNELALFEAKRSFLPLVGGSALEDSVLHGTFLFKGEHTFNVLSGTFPTPHAQYYDEINLTNQPLFSTAGEVMRFRRKINQTNTSPAQPSQIAFVLGSVTAKIGNGIDEISGNPLLSQTDVNLHQIGNVFPHPIGRRALFNETAVVPVGIGSVISSGSLDFASGSGIYSNALDGRNSGEEGHYIYYIRIATTGNLDGASTDARYYFQRRPYYVGAFEPGAGIADDFAAADTLASRFNSTTTTRAGISIDAFLPNYPSPTPAQIPYQIKYPTTEAVDGNISSFAKGLVFDYLPAYSSSISAHDRRSGKIWWAVCDIVNNSHANASTSRSLWSWERLTTSTPRRRDAADSFGSEFVLTGFPALGTSVQYRDLAAGRKGYLYLACDSDDDAGSVDTDAGALVMIDASSGSVVMVAGQSVGGIYTSGGLQRNNVLGIAVDSSGLFTSSSAYDRIWSLHRGGLSYFDVNTDTGAVNDPIYIVTASSAGSGPTTFNTIQSGSIKGLGGFLPRGTNAIQNKHSSLIVADNSGSVYWSSTDNPLSNYSTSLHRLNRILGDATDHSFYTLHTTSLVDYLPQSNGILHIGGSTNALAGQSGTINAIRVHKRDPGDPEPDDIWLATGQGNNGSSVNIAVKIPTSSWGIDSDIGVGYRGNTLSSTTTHTAWTISIAPDGTAWLASTQNTGANFFMGVLESLGRIVSGSGTGVNISVTTLDANKWVQTVNISNNAFTPSMKGKRILLSNAQSANTGSFIVSGVLNSNNVVIFNSGVSESSSSFLWQNAGTEFDSLGTVGGAVGSWLNPSNVAFSAAYNWFPDESGYAFVFKPRTTSVRTPHYINHFTPVTYQFNSASNLWYRSIVHRDPAAASRYVHKQTHHLTNGVAVTFVSGATGPTEFIAGEHYTFPATIGIIKEATQELTWGYDIFYQKTTQVVRPDSAEALTDKTATNITARGGFINVGSVAAAATDDPFILSTSASIQLATYQRRITLNGSNGTQSVLITGNTTATSGFQAAVDFGSDQIASKLLFALDTASAFGGGAGALIDLYSSTAGSGPSSWTRRAFFSGSADCPAWSIQADSIRASTGDTFLYSRPYQFAVDLEFLDGDALFGSNVAQRYWKFVYRTSSSSPTPSAMMNIAGFDTNNNQIGVTDENRLLTAANTDYLANHVTRVVKIIDTGGNADIGPAINQVQLSVGSFSTDIASGDFFRDLSTYPNIRQEVRVSSVAGSVLTLQRALPFGFTNIDWEVVRNAQVIPRDSEGGSEEQARFPTSAGPGIGEVFICPITGMITYNDNDVTNSRTFRVERYVKVRREI